MRKRPYLAEHVALARNERQSTGELYERFLSRSRETEPRALNKWHHYFDVYERHLARFRGTECRMLEFGVMDGGSLVMWSEYLGPKAQIIGVDINPKTKQYDGIRPNVSVMIGNQSSQAVLDEIALLGPFDIVIDDGGHTARQQISTFNGIYGSVADNGVFVCEDTHTSYWRDFQDAGPDITMVEHAKKLIDEMHSFYKDRPRSYFTKPPSERQGDLLVTRFAASTFSIQFYDSMIVFEKRPRSEPWSEIR
ncbi:class I SAM-dependent methyltransferase [Thalassobaculum sp.]|uniref:class I SAM-dependent methyltransferase n=1 Tax=Thalassobaculum sp. TaxID=2022740 RepID=UPI0032EEAE2C